jgi:hypothetical protein
MAAARFVAEVLDGDVGLQTRNADAGPGRGQDLTEPPVVTPVPGQSRRSDFRPIAYLGRDPKELKNADPGLPRPQRGSRRGGGARRADHEGVVAGDREPGGGRPGSDRLLLAGDRAELGLDLRRAQELPVAGAGRIRYRRPGRSGRLVPVGLVDAATGEIRLGCTLAEFGNWTPPRKRSSCRTWRLPGDCVPVGEVEVRRGEHVHATDGDIGLVEGLVIDPASHPRHRACPALAPLLWRA